MSHKINANAMRLGISRDWTSKWFGRGRNYTQQLHQDLEIKKMVSEKLRAAGLDRIEIRRNADKVQADAFVARPGVAIGRGGTGIEELNAEIKKKLGANVEVKVNEIKKPDLSAKILANEIATGIERRMMPKLLAVNAIQKAKAAGANGIRVWIGGRINGAKQARVIKHSDGPVPLHTLRAKIDFASVAAETGDLGKFGIKVWVYKPNDTETESNN